MNKSSALAFIENKVKSTSPSQLAAVIAHLLHVHGVDAFRAGRDLNSEMYAQKKLLEFNYSTYEEYIANSDDNGGLSSALNVGGP